MKTILVVLSLAISTAALAHPPVSSYDGKKGIGVSKFFKFDDGYCSVEVTDQQFDDGSKEPKIILRGFESWGYSKTEFVITSKARNGVYYSEFKPRSLCGDWGGSIGYEKTLELKANSVKIVESYRCLNDLEKRVIDTTCNLK